VESSRGLNLREQANVDVGAVGLRRGTWRGIPDERSAIWSKSDKVELSHGRPGAMSPPVGPFLGKVAPGAKSVAKPKEASSTSGAPAVSQGRDQPRTAQKAQSPLLDHIDDDGVLGLTVANERDDAAVASGRPLHGAVAAADGERIHALIISAG